jgi:hypothetical protein
MRSRPGSLRSFPSFTLISSAYLMQRGRSVVTYGTRYLTHRSPEGAMVIETVVNGRPPCRP